MATNFYNCRLGWRCSTPYASWNKWFAWKPVYINGEKVWLRNIYRRRVELMWTILPTNQDAWEYGTIFDVLKE